MYYKKVRMNQREKEYISSTELLMCACVYVHVTASLLVSGGNIRIDVHS